MKIKIRSKSLMGTYRKNGNLVQDYHIITNESKEYKMQVETINGKKKISYFDIHFVSNAGRMNFV
jgi:hypothetical protein